MAIAYLGSDGFDNGAIRPLSTEFSSAVNVKIENDGSYVKTGLYSCMLQGTNTWLRYAITGTPANCSVSCWVVVREAWNENLGCGIIFVLTTGEEIALKWDSTDKTFDAYVDGGKVEDGTIFIDAQGDFFQVQFYAVIDNAGSINVKIGGQESIAYSGDTLPIGASAQVEYIKFYNNIGGVDCMTIDDVIWGTGGYLGDIRVEWIPPNADTAVDDWLKSVGGDAYAVVDEVPPNSTDYLYTDTNAQSTELELTDWDDTDKTPLIVTAWALAYEDAATAESLKVGVDSGGVDDVTEHIMTDAYQYYNHFMDENPDGPAAWDNAAIDALKHRIESVI